MTKETISHLGKMIDQALSGLPEGADLADIGNSIGLQIGSLFDNSSDCLVEDFIAGLKHGLKLLSPMTTKELT